MPAIITPPDVERRPRRSEEHDGNNHGRRPPNNRDLKRTGGGGDNDSNDPTPRQRRPGARLAAFRIGLFCALAAVFMFFAGMVFMFFHAQSSTHIDAYNRVIQNWRPITLPRILWLNTAVLLLSSLTIEIARRRMFHPIDAMEEWFGLGKPTSRRTLPWLLATLVLGGLFLTGQSIAWHQLAAGGIPFRSGSPSSHSFYIITYAHAAHLAAGIAALIAAILGLYTFRTIENRQILVDCVAWYWHSMGALWLALFLLLTFCQ
ncbi:MAG TPA: cytochrome c oxidase subunit 3 [Acidobacteriaceae bacterium]|nr:cytochrome c oxidase subunit 3 [Acidobacteriaceae bacterium]